MYHCLPGRNGGRGGGGDPRTPSETVFCMAVKGSVLVFNLGAEWCYKREKARIFTLSSSILQFSRRKHTHTDVSIS